MISAEEMGAVPECYRIAVVGGGPGGLFTAHQLQQRCSLPFEVTLYEASERLGGKILTAQFQCAPVNYEGGAAELYDYSHLGEDPLFELIRELGLPVKPMSGTSVVINDELLHDLADVERVYGQETREALAEFDENAKHWMTPEEYYDADWAASNGDPKSNETFFDELARVPDGAARRFLRVLVHSDVATEPHLTSAAYGLQNYLMNDARYLRLYTIVGGIERLPQEVASRIHAKIRLHERVTSVEPAGEGRLRVRSRRDEATTAESYDAVIVALPNSSLPAIDWGEGELGAAMHRHHVHYDHPAHYLRVSVIFREEFWREYLEDSYLMLEAFGGCCLYDESSRGGCGDYGVLGLLLSGDAAMLAANETDERLIEMALDALPTFLRRGRGLFLEGQVHRWIGSVNGLPGGHPAQDMDQRHFPVPGAANLMVVGDYLFDSTLNGVLDSADYVAECLTEAIEERYSADASRKLKIAAV